MENNTKKYQVEFTLIGTNGKLTFLAETDDPIIAYELSGYIAYHLESDIEEAVKVYRKEQISDEQLHNDAITVAKAREAD